MCNLQTGGEAQHEVQIEGAINDVQLEGVMDEVQPKAKDKAQPEAEVEVQLKGMFEL